MNSLTLCSHCCKWANDHDGADPKAVMEDYPAMMEEVLNSFGLAEVDAENFIADACFGNWQRMHETDEERQTLDARHYADIIVGDVWYCSDRWSWDRVIRIQWAYQRLRDRCGRYGSES